MEFIGAFPEGEWESLGKMFSSEDLDFTSHFLGQCSFNPNLSHNNNTIEGILNLGQSSSFPIDNTTESLFQTLDSLNSNIQYLSQESSYSTSTNSGTQESYNYFTDSCHIDHGIASMPNFFMDHENYNNNNNNNVATFNDNVVMEDQNMCNNLKRIYDSGAEDKPNAMESSPPNPKKRTRVSKDVQKSKKNGKGQNGKSEEEMSNTSSYSSEDENASQENNGGAAGETSDGKAATVNLNGKARASRGSATDPQSLYARKRRERINERLRILQNIVPNGTKVDISTMLEEAVNYVKFLQLQIKLLSSDDTWMYAPIAYNGMDIGLNKKLSQLV